MTIFVQFVMQSSTDSN
uniref:Uncharacterized protein n=1 Tax=Arundo donax TaxID=35708 RepID=A0A0A8Z9C2_ARUDO